MEITLVWSWVSYFAGLFSGIFLGLFTLIGIAYRTYRKNKKAKSQDPTEELIKNWMGKSK